MRNRAVLRRMITFISVFIGFLSFAYMVYQAYLLHRPVPLWNKVTLAYGGVFCVFLFFDEVGRQAAKLRKEQGQAPTRPRPTVSSRPEHRAVVAASAAQPPLEVRLERVNTGTKEVFASFLVQYLEETLALEGKRPDEEWKNPSRKVEEWMADERVHPFCILNGPRPIGCCILKLPEWDKESKPLSEVSLLYLEPSSRRRGAGSSAMDKLVEFSHLLAASVSVHTHVAAVNLRAQQFLASCGFRKIEEKSPNSASVAFER